MQNARTAQEIVFNEAVTATHIRLVATSIYANGGQQYVAAKRIRVLKKLRETEGVTYNFYKESDFWDYEAAYGTLLIRQRMQIDGIIRLRSLQKEGGLIFRQMH